jgi:integrase/recombinase XerD
LTWAQAIRRHSGEAQLSIVGKGSKGREVLIPAVIAARLFANGWDAPASAPVFPSVRRPGSPLTERAVNFIVKEAAKRAGVNPAASIRWLRHAYASHAIDNGAPITPVSDNLGHADLKNTQRLCACPTWRKQRPVFEDEVLANIREDHDGAAIQSAL